MTLSDAKRTTALFSAAVTALCIAYDVVMKVFFGGNATISAFLMRQSWVIPLLIVASSGLIAHLYWAQPAEQDVMFRTFGKAWTAADLLLGGFVIGHVVFAQNR